MKDSEVKERKIKEKMSYHSSSGIVYVFGLVGALIYFIQHTTSFWGGVLGILESLVWPAILVYKAFELLKF